MQRVNLSAQHLLALAISLVLMTCVGCGNDSSSNKSSNGGTINSGDNWISGRLESGDFTLADGSYYDRYHCTAGSNGTAQIEMTSSAFDPYVLVYKVDSDGSTTYLGRDDDGGAGLNSLFEFSVTKGTKYEIRANSYRAKQTGSYSIRFGAPLGSVTAVSRSQPDGGAHDVVTKGTKP